MGIILEACPALATLALMERMGDDLGPGAEALVEAATVQGRCMTIDGYRSFPELAANLAAAGHRLNYRVMVELPWSMPGRVKITRMAPAFTWEALLARKRGESATGGGGKQC